MRYEDKWETYGKIVRRKDLRGVFASSPRFAFVPSVDSEDSDGWRVVVARFDEIRNEVGFVGVVESCDLELKFARMANKRCEVSRLCIPFLFSRQLRRESMMSDSPRNNER